MDKTLRQLKPGCPFVINIGDRKYPLSQVLQKHCDDRGYTMRRIKGGIMNNAGFGRDADGGEKFYELTCSEAVQTPLVEVSKPWQRGYDIGYLTSLEDQFADYNGCAKWPSSWR